MRSSDRPRGSLPGRIKVTMLSRMTAYPTDASPSRIPPQPNGSDLPKNAIFGSRRPARESSMRTGAAAIDIHPATADDAAAIVNLLRQLGYDVTASAAAERFGLLGATGCDP